MVGHSHALGADAALVARRLALEVLARLLAAALAVRLALVAAAVDRIADVAAQTRARGRLIDDFALGVLSARGGMAQLL